MCKEQQLPDGYHVFTYEQTGGRGQVGNTWHSQSEKNVLLSTLIYPHELHIVEQFILSEIVALAAKRTLDKYTEGICIKWPNDIYWHNKKIAGILIENSIVGAHIKLCIAGIGINVNQASFPAEVPNPISLTQITGKEYDKKQIVSEFLHELHLLKQQMYEHEAIHRNYCLHLYRAEGMHLYRSDNESFLAKIHSIAYDGKLTLQKKDDSLHEFYFKEVEFIL